MSRVPRFLLVTGALCLSVMGSSAWSAPSLAFEPATQSVVLGNEASVSVRISDVKPDGLGDYDFDVLFDPGILAFDRAVDGLGLGLAIGLGVTPGVGSLRVSDFSLETAADLLAMQGDDFVLFSLVFDTLAQGTSALQFDQVVLGDADGDPLTPAALGAGSITVGARAIPEPASMALVLGAVLAAALPGRRRRHRIE